MAWLVKDGRDNSEWIFEYEPERSVENGFWWDSNDSVELPKGSIKKLIGRELTWSDEPVELE